MCPSRLGCSAQVATESTAVLFDTETEPSGFHFKLLDVGAHTNLVLFRHRVGIDCGEELDRIQTPHKQVKSTVEGVLEPGESLFLILNAGVAGNQHRHRFLEELHRFEQIGTAGVQGLELLLPCRLGSTDLALGELLCDISVSTILEPEARAEPGTPSGPAQHTNKHATQDFRGGRGPPKATQRRAAGA
jgi:hypothetical protein